MNSSFLMIASLYQNMESNEIDIFLNSSKDISSKIGLLPIQRDLTNEISLCFVLNPIKESNWRVYKKLKPNAKVGFLSRKLMGMARK